VTERGSASLRHVGPLVVKDFMRITAFLILGLLLIYSLASAQTNVTAGAKAKASWAYPQTGISSADLEPAFADFKQVLPTNRVAITAMTFYDSNNAVITVRADGKTAGSDRDFSFQRVDGKWALTREPVASRNKYQGITPTQLEEAIKQIKEGLPASGILSMSFLGETSIEVWTGRINGPLAGSGIVLRFQKKNGKWTEDRTRRSSWIS